MLVGWLDVLASSGWLVMGITKSVPFIAFISVLSPGIGGSSPTDSVAAMSTLCGMTPL